MITSKHTRCCRFVWARITKYPYSTPAQLAGEQTDYSEREISRAVDMLERAGYIRRDTQRVDGYVAVIPFVCQVPAWAAH